jgi:predicted ATP-dependent endonuclease of OLD family
MKIRHLTINNFKGIDNLTIDFCDQFGQVRPVTVISGPNGSGKTSVLDAIWFGLLDVSRVDEPRSTFRAEPSIVVKSGAKFASVSFEMEISEEEKELINIWKNELIESKAIGNSPDIQSRHITLDWTYPAQPGYTKNRYSGGYRTSDDFNILRGNNYAENLRHRSAIPVSNRERMGRLYMIEEDRAIIESTAVKQYRPIKTANSNAEITSENLQFRFLLIDFGLKSIVGKPEDDPYKRIQQGFNTICAPRTMGKVFSTNKDGQDEYDIEFTDEDGNIYGIDGLSSGEQSVLTFLVRYFHKRLFNSIILIDELETHLHPTWQRRLLSTLVAFEDNNQFIVTTHAPTIVQSVTSEARVEFGRLDNIPQWQYINDADAEDE